MTHICALKKSQTDLSSDQQVTFWKRLKTKLQNQMLVSEKNPHSHLHFRSRQTLQQERQRQLDEGVNTIHPFSNFRKWYDLYVIFLYTSLLLTKPIDGCFMSRRRFNRLTGYKEYSLVTDVLSWIDMALTCFTGVYMKETDYVELRRSAIVRKYLTGPYFVCDVISAFPKSVVQYLCLEFDPLCHHIGTGFINIGCLFKIVRIGSLVTYVDKLSVYVTRGYRRRVMTACNLVIFLMMSHWLTCLHFGTSKILRYDFLRTKRRDTWIAQSHLTNATMLTQYVYAAFKSNAYILGVQLGGFYSGKLPEEYILGAFTYIVGKILVIYAWIFLAVAIINSRSTNIKFDELLNQLEEFMTRKSLPWTLRNRLVQYYYYKYQKKYVKEQSIVEVLSNKLNSEVNVHKCMSMLNDVPLFSELNQADVSKIFDRLALEIFLPNDTIFSAGCTADAMYFLATGTVAVYTKAGKEVAHLQDGAYFGEISLLTSEEVRMTTVVAIEMCQVYRLNRRDFHLLLFNNREIMEKIVPVAQRKLELMKNADDDYWKMMLEKIS